MLIARPLRRGRPLGLTPLIDVVFLLLIFFMLATTFLDTARVSISVPQIDNRAPPDPTGVSNRIRVALSPGGSLTLNGEATPLSEIERQVRDRLGDRPGQVVQVAPAAAVRLQQVIDLLDRLAAAGAKAISIERQDPVPENGGGDQR